MSYSIILLAETLLEWGCMRGLTSGRIVEHGFAGTFETSNKYLTHDGYRQISVDGSRQIDYWSWTAAIVAICNRVSYYVDE
jgi:hypothetical protein